MKVKELMKKALVVDRDVSLQEAADIMSKKRIGSLLYVDGENKIKGIITEGDLIKNFEKKENISKAMSVSVITVEPSASLEEALEIMKDNKVKRLPVVEKGELQGIITMTDLAANADELEGDFFFD